MKVAIYPGSFDPLTYGHIDILGRAQKLFDRLIVLVSKNPKKKYFFSLQERLTMIEDACKFRGFKNLEIMHTDKLTVEFAKEIGASCIVRGIRTLSDFDYEFQMALANKILNKEIETIFLMTDEKYTVVTSSLVKEIAKYGGNLEYFVPKNVMEMFKNKIKSGGNV
jgi:pantetheine-phosphate adenylyltransferase